MQQRAPAPADAPAGRQSDGSAVRPRRGYGNYDKRPVVPAGTAEACTTGRADIAARLRRGDPRVIVVDAYPGVGDDELAALVRALAPDVAIDARRALRPAPEIEALVAPDVGEDPVFGRLTTLELEDFFDDAGLDALRAEVARASGCVVVYGIGASLVSLGDVSVHVSLPRREIELRQNRGGVTTIGTAEPPVRPSLAYKRAFFVDWRVADRHKQRLWRVVDFVLDATDPGDPKLLDAPAYFRALDATVRRPFRVVPWFEPAPWGGEWMREVCDLPPDEVNFGWCFDCVPEENSLVLGYGAREVEMPSLDLVLRHPFELLGRHVFARFGAEFPIRFDFLDTMDGGNLSLQVHPLTDYIREHFGVGFTQDESYYLLDADDDAQVFLGVRDGVDGEEMVAALREAQDGGPPFPAERFVNVFPARRHDHFLIPAGTVHCSGANSMVLEISATPYIFTFKLWDWGRMGLDGRPRPVHIDHGARNIRWHRDTAYTRAQLVNQVTPLTGGPGWRAERTGLHEAEFIETHRHWFRDVTPHHTGGGVNVLNLVEGEAAVVESPTGAFEPFEVHYAETFIVPAAVGDYTIRPLRDATECATVKAFVRPTPAH